jgi:SNF2 family DNA or RNA helicase
MIAETKMIEEECHPILKTAKKVTEKADRAACQEEEIAVSNRGFRSDEKFFVQTRRKANTRRKQDTRSSRDKNGVASRSSLENRVNSASSKSIAGSNAQMTSEFDSPPIAVTKKGTKSTCAKFNLTSLPTTLLEALKPHQLEGISFMYDNCFGNGSVSPGGCVLAHNMGLGKTATALSFLFSATKADLVQSALIVVPTNTIGNWKREFERWIGYDVRGNALYLEDLDESRADSKVSKVKRFMRIEGPRALLVSHQTFSKIVDEALDADMIIIDEAHIPLSNSATQG